MTAIHVSHELARRLEAVQAWEQAAAALARRASRPDEGCDAIEIGGGWAIFGGVESPITKAEGLGLDGAVADEVLDRVDVFFRDRGARPRVTVCPYADESLLVGLAARGYRLEELENKLVRPVTQRDEWPEARTGVATERVDAASAEVWVDVVSRGFLEGGALTPGMVRIAELIVGTPEAACFLARVDGRPAGGGAMIVADGVASLYATSTVPETRRRGVQAALIAARLAEAASRGCDLAMVLTKAGTASQRNVERAGFRVAYTKAGLVAPEGK